MFLGLFFILLPLLLFPINLIYHFKERRTGLPHYSYSFGMTVAPIVLVLVVPAFYRELQEWPEISTGFGLGVLAWYALIVVALVLDIRRNKELQERVLRQAQIQEAGAKAEKERRARQAQAETEALVQAMTRKRTGGKQVDAILILLRNPRNDAKRLVEQIQDQQVQLGHRIGPNCSAVWVVAGNSIGDGAYAYGALRSQFPQFGAGVIERAVQYPFQAPDGETGEYYVVYG
jgi:hypothetical protein